MLFSDFADKSSLHRLYISARGLSRFIMDQSTCSGAVAQYCMLARSIGDVDNCRRHKMCGVPKFKLNCFWFFLSESQSKFQDTDHTKYTVYLYIQTHHISTYSSHSLLYIFIQFIDILRTYSKGTSSESDIQIYTCLYVIIIIIIYSTAIGLEPGGRGL